MGSFIKKDSVQVLIATDLASKGVDIPDLELVIQLKPAYDVHRY